MKRYRTRKGQLLKVGEYLVTDDAKGVALPDTPAVHEHKRLERLLPVTTTEKKVSKQAKGVQK